MVIGMTGATGTLGRRLSSLLIGRNYQVTTLCRNSASAKHILGPSAKIVEGDITREDTLQSFVADLDVCIHLAAQVDHTDKKRYMEVNVNGTKNLCNTIMKTNPKCRLVYCSSIAVLRRNAMKTNYSNSKAMAEDVVRSMMAGGLAATIIYSGLIFGPGDERFIPFLMNGLKKGNIPLAGGGESWAPVIYIDDLCKLFIRSSEAEFAVGRSFLGIQQTSAGMHYFIKIIAEQCGYPVPCKRVSKSRLMLTALSLKWVYSLLLVKKMPPINKRIVDILSINYHSPSFEDETHLGWSPETSMEAGIKAFLNGVR